MEKLNEEIAQRTEQARKRHGAKFNMQVLACKGWIKKFWVPRKTLNRTFTSYSYKHAVEVWRGDYVSNEAFIVAASELGFKSLPAGFGSPNCYYWMAVPKEMLDTSCMTTRHG